MYLGFICKEYYSDIKKEKKKKILPFVTTWMRLEGRMLSEISKERKKDN